MEHLFTETTTLFDTRMALTLNQSDLHSSAEKSKTISARLPQKGKEGFWGDLSSFMVPEGIFVAQVAVWQRSGDGR